MPLAAPFFSRRASEEVQVQVAQVGIGSGEWGVGVGVGVAWGLGAWRLGAWVWVVGCCCLLLFGSREPRLGSERKPRCMGPHGPAWLGPHGAWHGALPKNNPGEKNRRAAPAAICYFMRWRWANSPLALPSKYSTPSDLSIADATCLIAGCDENEWI
jgi:hypothetical protein